MKSKGSKQGFECIKCGNNFNFKIYFRNSTKNTMQTLFAIFIRTSPFNTTISENQKKKQAC